jgi:hypothetical protein
MELIKSLRGSKASSSNIMLPSSSIEKSNVDTDGDIINEVTLEEECNELAIKLHQSFPEPYDWMGGSFERDWMYRVLNCKKGTISKAYQAMVETITLMDNVCSTVNNGDRPTIHVQGFEVPPSPGGEVGLLDYPPFCEIRKHITWSFHKYSNSYAPLFILRAVSQNPPVEEYRWSAVAKSIVLFIFFFAHSCVRFLIVILFLGLQ